jgi:hypothetical protein
MTWIQKDITIVAPEDNKELRVRQIVGECGSIEIDIVHRGQAQESIILPKSELLEFMAHVQAVLEA